MANQAISLSGCFLFVYKGCVYILKVVSKNDKGKSGIYKITNIVNNKVYIGQSIDLWTRINEGYLQKLPKGNSHNIHLQRSWDKYGKESFKFEVLEYIDNYKLLNERETYWIQKYNACNKEYGYNIVPEGGSNRGLIKSEESKLKQSIAVSGKKNGMYGKTHTEEVKKRLSKARSVPIVQFDLNGNYIREWNSVKEASEFYNIARTPITRALRKVTSTSCGFIWIYKDEYIENGFNIETHRKRKNIQAVIQLTIDGTFIKEFETITQARNETGVRNITVVCQGIKNMAGGFKWMYKEDYELQENKEVI